MKKTFLEKKRMLLSMLTLVAFLFVGMSGVAAQSEASDLVNLQTRVEQINQDVQTLPDGTAKKTYYTKLVTYYNAIIEDVEQNNLTYIRAVKTNYSLMPMGPEGKIISSHIPVSSRVAE